MINSNRKLVSCVIALIVSIIVSIPLIANALIIYNDPNGDGDIELNDNILITQYLEGSIDVTNLERLDFDNDNIISMADAFEVQLYNLGLLNPGSINLPSAATYNGSSSETYHVFDASTGDLLLYNAYTLYNYNPIPNNLNEPNVTDDIIAITDERVPIWDKSGVVKIMTPNSYIGSGFVIAPHIIATAAHCVFDNSTLDPNDILSESGYIISGIKLFDSNGVNTLTATPVECHVPYSYISAVKNGNYENAFDYALISVEEDLSDYMCFNLGVALDSAVTNEVEISISGFPYEINYVQVNNATNHQMYKGSGLLKEWDDYLPPYIYLGHNLDEDRQLYYTADTSEGNSGGPVYVTKDVYDKNGNNHQVYYDVVAIHTYGWGTINGGTRINSELIRFYLNNNNPNW